MLKEVRMNKIRRVIWSGTRNCFVVVSELVKGHVKRSHRTTKSRGTVALLCATLLCSGVTSYVGAADETVGTGNGVAYGTGSVATDATGTALGNGAQANAETSSAFGNSSVAKGQGSIALGASSRVSSEGAVALGRTSFADGKSSISIGDNARVKSNGYSLTSIAMGKNAYVLNGTGQQEYEFSFNKDSWNETPAGLFSYKYDPKEGTDALDRLAGGIAIGTNAYARTGSVEIGGHTMQGKIMGGTTVDGSSANIIDMTTIGTNSYNKGMMATIVGAYSINTGDFNGSGGFNSLVYGSQNMGSVLVGSLNQNRSKGKDGSSGIANAIVGVANIAENANGALIYGAGNKITNSIASISGFDANFGVDTVDEMQQTLTDAIRSSKGGGATMAFGGGNVADYINLTMITGVKNTVKGTADNIIKLDSIIGYNNAVTGASDIKLIGNSNTIEEKASNNIIFGDNYTLKSGKTNNVILGSAEKNRELDVSNATILGYNANVQKEGGVALGSESVASVNKETPGYDPLTGTAYALSDSDKDSAYIWQSTRAAVSVGDLVGDTKITRQITGVAAGTNDTDAVNVAQLKRAMTTPVTFYSGGSKASGSYVVGGTKYEMKLSNLKFDFGDGIKAEEVGTDGDKKIFVSLDKDYISKDDTFKGPKGEAGADGKSAYDVWKENGNDGKTEKEFIDSLKGEPGKDGADGTNGADGKSAYEVWKENGHPNGTIEEYEKSIKGEPGEKGADGKSAYDIWKNSDTNNANKTEQEFLDSLKGKDGKDGKDGGVGKVQSGDSNIVVSPEGMDSTTPSKPAEYEVSLSKNISVDSVTASKQVTVGNTTIQDNSIHMGDKGSLTIGNSTNTTTVNANGLTITNGPSITTNGIDAGGKKIFNVVGSELTADSTYAVNGGQLYTVREDLNNRIDGVDKHVNALDNRIRETNRRVDKVGAGAAALAALHPLDFDADDKWNIAAGVGAYKGTSAMALGAFYRPNEVTQLSIGGAFGNGENMWNMGISWRTGSGESYSGKSKAELVRMVNAMEARDAQQDAIIKQQQADIQKQQEGLAKQEAEINELKAMVQRLLAK